MCRLDHTHTQRGKRERERKKERKKERDLLSVQGTELERVDRHFYPKYLSVQILNTEKDVNQPTGPSELCFV